MFGFGNSLTHVTGYLNLMSSSKAKFNPIFVDSLIFVMILYVDAHSMAPRQQIAAAYFALIAFRSVQYFLFLRSMISQICDYLDIPFITVKQNYVSKKNTGKK